MINEKNEGSASLQVNVEEKETPDMKQKTEQMTIFKERKRTRA